MAVLLIGSTAQPVRAQTPEVPNPLTLREAMNYALAHYSAIRARKSEIAAAKAGVNLARTANLPKVDTLLALNRATRNNVFGALLPQSTIPSISGPVLNDPTGDSVFGSAIGALVGWEPFDFGLRKANEHVAEAGRDEATARLELTEHQVAFAAAESFLAVAASQQAAKAAQANVSRLQVFADTVHVLVENQLRPGSDESRIQVELALARTQAIRAEERVAVSLANLAEALGASGATIRIDASNLLAAPPSSPAPAPSIESHPLAQARMAIVRSSEARQEAIDKSYSPKFTVQGAIWSRGTGALLNGDVLHGFSGLAPSTSNGAIGLSLQFPLSDFAALRQKKTIEQEKYAAEKALYDETVQKLTGDAARARAERDSAEKVAQNTPSEMRAARAMDEQSRARYQAGLGTIVDVADAQRILAQAEIDDAVARLAVWRARLSEAAAAGDIRSALK
jgi:outer membrane protein TolC